MVVLPSTDDSLESLQRTTIPSGSPAVHYRVDRILGSGGMAIAFFALRMAPDGQTPVVLKITRPGMVRGAGAAGILSVRKESVALGRLNERVPPTPFVVRLIEGDALTVMCGGTTLELPWLALEYVHGGFEGTTLEERIAYSVQRTGFAFDPNRAALAIACMASGLDAIHEVGVIHRDIKPSNVLCCGFGEDEVLKIADFGIARPRGVAATFGGIPVGTPGYAAPEQVMLDDARLGTASDVFSLAGVIFRMLTGEDYLPAATPVDCVVLAQQPARRSITESRWLSPELRERQGACATIDMALGRATAADSQHRPQSGSTLAALCLARMYERGLGVDKNEARMFAWLSWGEEHGNRDDDHQPS